MFGRKALGQLIGATVIGAMVFGLPLVCAAKGPPVGALSTWVIGGAAAGFTAGLILLSPRVFFGSFFGLLGLLIAIVPMGHTDGSPAALGEHAIKVGIGAILMAFSIILVASRIRNMARDTGVDEQASTGDDSQPFRSE